MKKEEEGIGLKTLPYHKSQEREFLTGFYLTIGGRRSTKNISPIGVYCTFSTMLGLYAVFTMGTTEYTLRSVLVEICERDLPSASPNSEWYN